MVKDVVPELQDQIGTRFRSSILRDRTLQRVGKRIETGRADLSDAHAFAERLGFNLSDALVGTLTQENLPNGTLYYNIAERTVIPALENNYELVNEAATTIQKTIDQQVGIGLGSVRADFPLERIQNLIDKMTADDITYEQVIRWLMEPIVNNSEAFADDYIRANADFRAKAGLRTKITRRVANNCCDWCAAMAGTWIYGSEPPDIYRRHEYCRCTVTYQSGKTSQNVWSKRKWESSPEEKAIRKVAGLLKNDGIAAVEKIEVANAVYRDKVISTMESKDRRKNLRKYSRMSAEERLARLKEFEEKRAMRG